MKVVLVRPPAVLSDSEVRPGANPPLGLAYLAAGLQARGYEVSAVDAVGEDLRAYRRLDGVRHVLRHGLTDPEILERIPTDAQIVAFSCMFSTEWPLTHALIDATRSRLPHALIVAGGEHVTSCPEYCLRTTSGLDACGLGEGDDLIVDLAEAVVEGADLDQVPGLVYRRNGIIRHSPPRNRVRAIDGLPWPAWDILPIRNYIDAGITHGVPIGRTIPMLASRGCPYRCTFCSSPQMWGTLWRARNPEDVLEEMKYYRKTYDVTNFDFWDLTAIVNRQWIIRMAQLLIENQLDITWQLPSGTRSEAMDEEVLALMYQSGCRQVTYAPEHGSDSVLRKIKKRIKKPAMEKSVRAAYRAGIVTKANFIVGFPDETIRDTLASYRYAIRLARSGMDDVSFFPFSPYPGSELFVRLEEEHRAVLSDDHFFDLVRDRKSYSAHIPDFLLPILTTIGMILFYSVSFALRPKRMLSLARAIVSRKPTTRLQTAILRLSRLAKMPASLDPAPGEGA
jgi:radical SAM superfamily enzyme YgiQ (UPF0313 family)